MENPQRTIKTFVSYSHDDDELLDALQKHFALLKRHRAVELWTDRGIVPGDSWSEAIYQELEAADLILLLISSSFLASDFCYETEMQRALERHNEGTARVVPIILRPCDWTESPFAKLQALPHRAQAITSWGDQDTAMTDVAKGIRRLLNSWALSKEAADTYEESEEFERRPSKASVSLETLDPGRKSIVHDLEAAYAQRDSLRKAKLDTTAIDTRILDLKRHLRNGPQLQPGEFLGDGRFQLIRPIGQGGFATVWLAQDRRAEIQVAVKVLHGQFSNSDERRERLFRGARQMAKLDHPHIVQVLSEPRVEEDWAFFVMEYLEDGDFRRAVLDGRLDVKQRLDVIEKVAFAIDYAHEQRVVHRDIKPANILLDAANSPKLTDFDLVLAEDSTGLTRTKVGMGSYLYAAPESMDDAAGVTASSDIYSLAATLVFAMQGKGLDSLFLIEREAYLSNLGLVDQALSILQEGLHPLAKERPRSALGLILPFRSAIESEIEAARFAEKDVEELGHRRGLGKDSSEVRQLQTTQNHAEVVSLKRLTLNPEDPPLPLALDSNSAASRLPSTIDNSSPVAAVPLSRNPQQGQGVMPQSLACPSAVTSSERGYVTTPPKLRLGNLEAEIRLHLVAMIKRLRFLSNGIHFVQVYRWFLLLLVGGTIGTLVALAWVSIEGVGSEAQWEVRGASYKELQSAEAPSIPIRATTPSPTIAALHPELETSRDCLDVGNPECGQEALGALKGVDLTQNEENEKVAIEAEVSALETRALITSLGASIVLTLEQGPITSLEEAIDSIGSLQGHDDFDISSFDGSTRRAITKGNEVITAYRRMLEYKRSDSHLEVVRDAELLSEIYPPYALQAKTHREVAARAIEEAAKNLIHAGDLEAAAASLQDLDSTWPGRSGVLDKMARVQRLQRLAEANKARERELVKIESIIEDRRLNEGEVLLKELRRVLPASSPHQNQVDRLYERIQELLDILDQRPPVVSLAWSRELQYKPKEPCMVELVVTDDYEVMEVQGFARYGEGGDFVPGVIRSLGKNRYVLELDPQSYDNPKRIEFYVEALDRSGHKGGLGSTESPLEITKKSWFKRARGIY